jgi:hypothetical protein
MDFPIMQRFIIIIFLACICGIISDISISLKEIKKDVLIMKTVLLMKNKD